MSQLINEESQAAARQSLGGLTRVVSTIAQLRQVPDTDLTGTMQTLGASSVNDGLGGLYYWNPTDSSPDNGGTIIKPVIVGSAAGRFNLIAIVISSGITVAGLTPTPVTLLDAPTIALDASLGLVFDLTLTGDHLLGNPTNPRDGQSIVLRITQGVAGNHLLTYDTAWGFGTDVTSPTLSTAAGAIDYINARYNAVALKWHVLAVARGY